MKKLLAALIFGSVFLSACSADKAPETTTVVVVKQDASSTHHKHRHHHKKNASGTMNLK